MDQLSVKEYKDIEYIEANGSRYQQSTNTIVPVTTTTKRKFFGGTKEVSTYKEVKTCNISLNGSDNDDKVYARIQKAYNKASADGQDFDKVTNIEGKYYFYENTSSGNNYYIKQSTSNPDDLVSGDYTSIKNIISNQGIIPAKSNPTMPKTLKELYIEQFKIRQDCGNANAFPSHDIMYDGTVLITYDSTIIDGSSLDIEAYKAFRSSTYGNFEPTHKIYETPYIYYVDSKSGDFVRQYIGPQDDGSIDFYDLSSGNVYDSYNQYIQDSLHKQREAKIAAEKEKQEQQAAAEKAKAEAAAEKKRQEAEEAAKKEQEEAEKKAQEEAQKKIDETNASNDLTKAEKDTVVADAAKQMEAEQAAAKAKADEAIAQANAEANAAKEAAAQKEADALSNIDDTAEQAVDEAEEKNDEALEKVEDIEKKKELEENLDEEKENSKANDEDIEQVKNSTQSTVNAESRSREVNIVSRSSAKTTSSKFYESASKYFQGSPFESMIFAGVDFLKQNFDIGLVFYSKEDKKIIAGDWDEVVTMWTRMSSITVPRLKAATFNLKTPIGSVEKIKTKFEGQYETTLNLRLDENLQVLDFFNRLAYNDVTARDDLSEDHKQYDYYVRYFPSSAINAKANLVDKLARVDIVVKHSDTMNPESGWRSDVDWISSRQKVLSSSGTIEYANEPLAGNRTMLWVFEDVNVVSTGDNVKFNRDGDGSKTVPIKFTYKRLARVVRD